MAAPGYFPGKSFIGDGTAIFDRYVVPSGNVPQYSLQVIVFKRKHIIGPGCLLFRIGINDANAVVVIRVVDSLLTWLDHD